MRWMTRSVTALTLISCMGCASQSQESRSAAGSQSQSKTRPSATATSQRADATNAQILLDKIKADKKLLVANNMDLTDAEAARFWPLYDEYQRGLDQVNQNLASTILEYAEAYDKGAIPDATASKLLDEALLVEEAEVALKKTYAAKFTEVLPAAKAARYLQIETKIRSMLRLDLARNIPLVS
ncbi:MAG TPA: hypothetical protein VJ805_10045 [Nitrospiraceae bacterium]|nr:hypothetical protein [Nitrospiraceae bacterium]